MRAHSRTRVFIYVFCSCFVRTALQQRTRLARWGCRRSSSSQKSADFWEPCWNGYLCCSAPMKRLYLTCFTRMKVKEISCMMILGINMVNKNRGLFLSPLFLFKSFELTTEVIEHNHIIFYAERVQEIKHSLGHHRRTAEVVLDVLWSVVLLEVGVAHHWSNEARSVLYTQCICLWIWTVQCQVEMEVRILLLQCQEILQEEYLVDSTSTIEIVHLTV